jgi:hypothetical protein
VESGTFDAPALLKCVLAAVEPTLQEGLRVIAESALGAEEKDEPCGVARAQAVRAVGRQVAEALRTAVVDGMRTRQFHLAQLAVIDRAAGQAASLAELRKRIDAEISKAGLRRISETTDLAAFNLADSGGSAQAPTGSSIQYELLAPAYSDTESGRIVERGWVRTLSAQRLDWDGVKEHDRKRHARTEPPPSIAAGHAGAAESALVDSVADGEVWTTTMPDLTSDGAHALEPPEPSATASTGGEAAAPEGNSAAEAGKHEWQAAPPVAVQEPVNLGAQPPHTTFTKTMLAKVEGRGYKPIRRPR